MYSIFEKCWVGSFAGKKFTKIFRGMKNSDEYKSPEFPLLTIPIQRLPNGAEKPHVLCVTSVSLLGVLVKAGSFECDCRRGVNPFQLTIAYVARY